MDNGQIFSKIGELTSKLTETDYKAIKHSEGIISDEEYKETKLLCQSQRDEINELQKQLK